MRIPSTNKVEFIKDTVTWVAPAIGIPALRYFQDRKEQRNELFVRDASTYSIGALIYISTLFGGQALLNRYAKKQLSEPSRKLIPFFVALTANILYAGIGSVRLSQLFSRLQAANQPKVPNALPKAPSSSPLFPQNNYFPMSAARVSYQA